VSGHHIHKRRTHECAYVPSKFCAFRESDRESEFGWNEITNLSYPAHTYTQTEYDTTPKLSVYPPIGCWWLVVLVTPIVPKTIPSLSKQNTGSGRQCGKTMGTQLQSAGMYMRRHLDTFRALCNLQLRLYCIGRGRDNFM
jgi:hypothetical protein